MTRFNWICQEVCIPKQNYMVEKPSENQFTNMSDDTVTISIIIYENWQQMHSLQGKNSNFEFEAWSSKNVSKLTYVCHKIRETFKFSIIKKILNKNKMFQLVFNLAGVGFLSEYWTKII